MSLILSNLFRKAVLFVGKRKMLPVDQRVVPYLRGNGDMLFCYFSLGLLLQIPVTVMRYFLVEKVGLGPAELAEAAALITFPWAVKPLTAFLSENIVSRCIRRNIQIAAAYGLAGLCWFAFLLFDHDRGSLFLVLLYAFLASFFTSYADVCLDACMVRRIHLDSSIHGGGRLQSFVLASRALGSLVGSFVSGGLALFVQPFLLIAILHCTGVFAGCYLRSLPVGRGNSETHKSTCAVCSDTCSALLWTERLIFVAVLFAIATPVSDFAIMQYFFQTKKKVAPMTFSLSDALASVMTIAASLFFNAFLRDKAWQSIVMLSQCILFALLATNMLLRVGLLDIDAGLYLVGRSVIGGFFGHIGFMPLVVRAADLVPDGLEGTFYSLYMSTVNLGSVVGEELSGLLTKTIGTTSNTALLCFYLIAIVHNIFSFLTFHLAYG